MGRDIQDYCLSILDILNNKFFREINVFNGAICGKIQSFSEFTIKAKANWSDYVQLYKRRLTTDESGNVHNAKMGLVGFSHTDM
jgi:hypothetical protein